MNVHLPQWAHASVVQTSSQQNNKVKQHHMISEVPREKKYQQHTNTSPIVDFNHLSHSWNPDEHDHHLRKESHKSTTTRNVSSPRSGEPEEQMKIRYVEVPIEQEVIKYLNVRRIIEKEKHVPKITKNEITKIIEIPQLKIVKKKVDVPQIKEVIKTVPVKKVVEIERERFQHIPKIETKFIEKEVEVFGDVIEVPKPFLVQNKLIVPRFVDQRVPTVVTQTLTPQFEESDEHIIEVSLKEYEPEVIPIDIFLPKPIDRNIVVTGNINRQHTPVEIPLAHYNALILQLNDTTSKKDVLFSFAKGGEQSNDTTLFSEEKDDAKFWLQHMLVPTQTGVVPILSQPVEVVPPQSNDWETAFDQTHDYIQQELVSVEKCTNCRKLSNASTKSTRSTHRKVTNQDKLSNSDCSDCRTFVEHRRSYPTVGVDFVEFVEGSGVRHEHLVKLKSTLLSDE